MRFRLGRFPGWLGIVALAVWFGSVIGLASTQASPRIEYAENFSVEDQGTHREVRVRNTWIGAGGRQDTYALVPKGEPLPPLDAGVTVVRTPVERLVIMETVFLGPIGELDLYDSLVGMASLQYSHDEEAKRRVAAGRVKELPAGMALDVESLLLLEPELILSSTTGSSSFDGYAQMRRAGLPVAVTADYMERHPLARAEWIKFLALFFGEAVEAEAEEAFRRVADRYGALASLATEVDEKPTVMYGAPYSGLWHVPGGQSYMAQAFADAGANYLWADNASSGGVPIDQEAIARRAADADFWLHPSFYDSMRALLGADERFALFRPVREGNVFNNTLRVNEAGGNDIFERGVARPDEVLADLIKIFHPDLLPEHQFVYYERLR